MQFFKPGVCFLLAFTAVLGFSEAGLRLLQVHHPASFFTSDPDLGYVLRPYAEGWNEEETDCFSKINSDGMRDREHTIRRPPDVVRIAFLGDSTTEAYQVPLDKTYVSLTEAALNRISHRKVEALNFAVRGYNLPQELIELPKKVWKYDPQIVVLALSMNGSILKSVRSLYTGDVQNSPFFVLENGELVLDRQSRDFKERYHPSPRRDRLMDAVNRSELLCLINAARVQSTLRIDSLVANIEPHAQAAGPLPAQSEVYDTEWPYLGQRNEALRNAWDLSFRTLLAIRDEVARHHAELWIVTLDMPMQTFPDPAARLAFQRKLGISSLFIPDQLIARFAMENHIRHAMMARLLARYVDQTHNVIHLTRNGKFASGHLNEIGHREVAAHLSRALASPVAESGVNWVSMNVRSK